jgi:hypothetical protein
MPAPFLFSRVLRPHEFMIASHQWGREPFGKLRAGFRTTCGLEAGAASGYKILLKSTRLPAVRT